MVGEGKKAVVVGALDTKGEEFAFVKEILNRSGIETLLIDTGVLGHPFVKPDISSEEVAAMGGSSLAELRKEQDRGKAIAVMSAGVEKIVSELVKKGEVAALFGMGGTAGTTLGAAAMKAAPVGIPKLLVSTVASGNTSPYVGVKDDGKNVVELTGQEAEQAKAEIDRRNMFVYCMSTNLFDDDIEKGEEHFLAHHMSLLDQTIRVAKVLQPRVIRLIAAKTGKWHPELDSVAYVDERHAWLWDMYRDAIDRIDESGFQVTIENEGSNCIMADPGQVNAFFEKLDRKEKVFFTYDVQNLWRMGTFPRVEDYEAMKKWIGYFHLKGGRSSVPGGPLEWRSSLEDATWPVVEMTQRAVNDGVSPVICLNPSHGKSPDGYRDDLVYRQDLEFLRKHIAGVE